MNSKTRKRIWPVPLAMSIGIIGVLAAFVVLAANPVATQAHDRFGGQTHDQLCDDMDAAGQADHDAAARDIPGAPLCGEDPGNGGNGGGTPSAMSADLDGETGSVESSSSSGSATVQIDLQIDDLRMAVPVGGSIVLYLEDDFQEPDSISASDVYFVSRPSRLKTGYSSACTRP